MAQPPIEVESWKSERVAPCCAHVRAKRNIKKHGYCRFHALGSVSGFSFSRSVGFSYFEEGICHAQPKNDFVAEDLTNNHLTYAAPIVN